MTRLSLLDLAFFIAESAASPKHVAGLHIHQIPKGGGAAFARQLFEGFLTHTEVQPPFDQVINFVSPTLMPSWRTAEHVDLAQHVFFHRLKPGANDRAALYALTARLHEPVLDRSRPLWEVHVIAGLWNRQFAVYYKMHHAVADGITMTRWGVASLRTTADDDTVTPVWALKHTRGGAGPEGRKRLDQAVAGTVWKTLTANSKRAVGIGRLTAMLALEAVKLTKNAIALPFMASSDTPFTGNATPGRQFTTAAVSMARIDAIRKVSRATINHVALTCLDGAMHRYLADEGVELDRPITIQMPVNLRREGDGSDGGGNKIGIILVDLSPPTDDAYVRLRNVGYSLRNLRAMVDAVAPEAVETYTLLTGLLGQIAGMLKLADVITPMGNTLVSNVPGPARRLYLKGAPLLEMHPVSTLPATHLLNITLFSYAGTLHFGLIATDALPNLGRLARYVEEEITTLEKAVGLA